MTEDDFYTHFGSFGEIERVDVKLNKGITYVKFAKTSEAANALEEMNGKSIGDDPRPLKFVIASRACAVEMSEMDVKTVDSKTQADSVEQTNLRDKCNKLEFEVDSKMSNFNSIISLKSLGSLSNILSKQA